MTRHLLLVALAVLAHTAFAQFDTESTNPPADPIPSQPCPFDCVTCDSSTQTCTSCADGFRLEGGRCHLEACDTAMAHPARMLDDGADDTRMATWDVTNVDSSLHEVTIEVFVPPRFHCEATGHALTDALHWEQWLANASASDPVHQCTRDSVDIPNGYCGPIDKRWTPVLMLGREADDTLGYIALPIGASDGADEKRCTSAYRTAADNYTIVDQRTQANTLVSTFNDSSGIATLHLPLMTLKDASNGCVPEGNFDSPALRDSSQPDGGRRYQYWYHNYYNGVTNWRFDATLCYVDETGEQSVCPFSSPVWELVIDEVTDGVSVTPAGTAELIYIPRCELFIRSAQIRYDGVIEGPRNATGEFEIAVTCEGNDYIPDIVNITHCECEQDADGHCIFYEDEHTCASDNSSCTTTALFKSYNFLANNTDYLQQDPCNAVPDGSNDNGKFVVEIGYDEGDCVHVDDGGCYRISNTKLFGAAPLQATDDLRDLAGYGDNSTHSIYAGLMKSNDLRVPDAPEDQYFHQFNRSYLEFTTIRRVVGPDQKNSFIMCAMMQDEQFDRALSVDPELIEHEFRVTILEVQFEIAWDPDTTTNDDYPTGKPNSVVTLAELLSENERWPSQWVWEHQDDLALRREVISRRSGRADDCTGGKYCQITPMQHHVNLQSEWDHIADNVDCVGISPFYLYSLLTLDNPEFIVDSATVNLTVKHEYLGPSPYHPSAASSSSGGGRRLLQADGADAPFSQATETRNVGAFVFTSKSDSNKVSTEEGPASPSEPTSIPVMPIVMGVMAASMTCMFFAAFAFWRRRKQPTREETKLGAQAHTQARQPQVVVQLEDVQLQQDTIAHSA